MRLHWRPVAMLLLAAAIALGWHRFLADFWPPDAARVAPNLLADAIGLLVGALVWQPLGRALGRLTRREIDRLHGRLDELHEHHARHQQHLELLAGELARLRERIEGPARDSEDP